MESQSKAKYYAPRRVEAARETRRHIRLAARQLFLAQGYAATNISQIARLAGVSDRTVYLAFGNKMSLLQAVMETAVAGDDAPIPIASRESWAEMLAAPAQRQLELFAAGTASICRRTAALFEMANAAAGADPEIASEREASRRKRLSDFRLVAESLAVKGALRDTMSIGEATDVLYCLASDAAYGMLVVQRGWSDDQFSHWLSAALAATLLA